MQQKRTVQTVILPRNMHFPVGTLRTAAYCRVSTVQDTQYGSLSAQIDYYTKYIESNPLWALVGVFADKSSGLNLKHRSQFNQMLEQCRNREIDQIVTKSVSRLGRNTLQVLLTCNELRALDIDVYFEIEGFYLRSPKGRIMLETFAAIAQEESRSKSANIKWGLRRSFEAGISKLQERPCYGYRRSCNGQLKIHLQEAEVIRKIFDWRIRGYSLRAISVELQKRGVKSPRGKDNWGTETLNKLLANEKYIGYVLLQKTFVEDFLKGRQNKNLGQLTQYLLENNHPAIISKAIFERAANGHQTAKKISL